MKTTTFLKRVFIGKVNGENIYLSAPSWDCGWYWGFGYLGNKNCHYHVDGLAGEKNIDLFNAFKKHFGESLTIKNENLWTVCELFKSFYTLEHAAELYKNGSAGYTSNPIAAIIKNTDEVTRINNVLMPAIFDEIYKLIC